MTRPLEKHLDDAELDALVSSPNRVTGPGPTSESILSDAERHAESCEDCNRKVQMHKHAQGELFGLNSLEPAQPGEGCPQGEEDWLQVAAGLLPDEKAKELMSHATQCDHCGPLLRKASEIVSDEATPAEERTLANLSSAQPTWQRDLAEKLRGIAKTRDRAGLSVLLWERTFRWPRLGIAAAAAILVVVGCLLGVRLLRAPSPDQLLAQAYTERRTLEMRFAGAKYAPFRVERGPGRSSLDKPEALLKVEALIAENLRKAPNDPSWLHARGRADLLDDNYESAIQSLQQALQAQPNSAELLTDLASGYVERADATGRAIDYGAAIDFLHRALMLSPDNSIAIFNRALCYERLLMYHEAIADWQRYLQLDAGSEWASEARGHLQDLKHKVHAHDGRSTAPLMQPEEFAQTVDAANEESWVSIDARIQDYLTEALQSWLPQGFPRNNGRRTIEEQRAVRAALETLGVILAKRHDDRWLLDVVSAKSAPSGDGIAALANSVEMNVQGRYDDALHEATIAEGHFVRANSKALLLRAQLEHLTALNRRFEGKDCRGLASTMQRELVGVPYSWIRIQSMLERANCLGTEETSGPNRRFTAIAEKEAAGANYEYLRLRALGFLAEDHNDPVRSFGLDVQGLQSYWAGTVSPSRAYQFFADLAVIAEDWRRWRLATALNREAVASMVALNRPAAEATARGWLGRAAFEAGYYGEASDEWSKARKLFSSLPPDTSTRSALAELAVNLAKVDLERGNLAAARGELNSAASRFIEPGLLHLSIDYFSTLGTLHEREGQSDAAQMAFQEAVARLEREVSDSKSVYERARLRDTCSQCFRSLVRMEIDAGRVRSALRIWEHYRNLPSFIDKGMYPNDSDIHIDGLHSDEVLYSLVDLGNRIVVWITTTEGSRLHEFIVPRDQLIATAARFAAECSSSESPIDQLRAHSETLYGWLLSPFEPEIAGRRTIIVEIDPNLPLFPFEALVDSSGQYLVESRAIAYTLGSEHLVRERPLSTALLSDRALIVAPILRNLGGSSGPTPLLDAVDEVQDVAELLPNRSVAEDGVVDVGFLSRELPHVSLFHFAGHASAAAGRKGLLVQDAGGDGVRSFTPEEAGLQDLTHLDLVVLSACSTTRYSAQDDLAELSGLTEEFLLAGSKLVVANKWAADSAASEVLMDQFYRNLAHGSPVITAINRAQLELGHRKPFAHPYFWSTVSIWI